MICDGDLIVEAALAFAYDRGMTNDPRKARLAELVKELAVIHQKVTLASGKESDFYVDMRRATLHHEAAPLVGHVMLDMREDNGFAPDDFDAFVVRKEAKDHGMKRQVEGPSVEGKRVIVLEDTSTTGGSPMQAARALEAGGAQVLAVAVIVDRDTGAREVIEGAGYKYLNALGLEDLGLA